MGVRSICRCYALAERWLNIRWPDAHRVVTATVGVNPHINVQHLIFSHIAFHVLQAGEDVFDINVMRKLRLFAHLNVVSKKHFLSGLS